MKSFAAREVLLPVFFLTGLLACGGETDGVSGDSAGPIGILVVHIQSPLDGATVTQGDEVFLQLEAGYEGGETVTADSVVWSIEGGSWSAEGNGLSVTDLPVGALQLVADAEVGRFVLSDAVSLTVEEEEEDPVEDPVEDPPLELSGNLDSKVKVWDGEGNAFNDVCKGSIAFVLDQSDLTGGSTCSGPQGELVLVFTGTVDSGNVSGLIEVTGSERTLSFSGHWDKPNQVLNGNFDETWENSDGFLRFWGSFQATVN